MGLASCYQQVALSVSLNIAAYTGMHISSPTKQILLFFFANSSFLNNIGCAEHVSMATICRGVRNVTLALSCTSILPKSQTQQTSDGSVPLEAIINVCHKALSLRVLISQSDILSGFPGVIGCIDCTNIPIMTASISEADYVYGRSVCNINAQVSLNNSLSFNSIYTPQYNYFS